MQLRASRRDIVVGMCLLDDRVETSMKSLIWSHIGCGRLAMTAMLLAAAFLLNPGQASAGSCGDPLSGSTGNIVGSTAGAVGGGLIGSQFGGGAGKGLLTGLGVVGGALAGGYVGRQVEGCNHRHTAKQAAAGSGSRTCRFVTGQATPTQATTGQPTTQGQAQQDEQVACLEQDGVWRTDASQAAEQAAETDLVLRAQQRLHDDGFYVRNNVDGRWGPATSAAMRNFQRTNGLASTGQLDDQTRTAMGLDPVPLADLTQTNPPDQSSPPEQGGPSGQGNPAGQAGWAMPPATTVPAASHR